MKKSQYKVAANDINKPSVAMLVSLLVPVMLICGLAYYILSMPLSDNVAINEHSYTTGYQYVVYLPFVGKYVGGDYDDFIP